MAVNPQDLEDAQQDYMLEVFQATQTIPVKTCSRRVKDIRVQNILRGRRTGSWVTGTLQYHKLFSLNVILDQGGDFTDEYSFDYIDDQILLRKVFSLCDLEERKLLRSYITNDSSPGLMAAEFQCSPQYINRMVNRLILNLSKRI